MAEASLRLPPSLDIHDGNLGENYKRWKREVDVYLLASGATEKPNAVQTAIILHCAGPQMMEVFEHFQFAKKEDKTNPEKVFQQIKEYCTPKQNVVLQTFRFWNVQLQEPFDTFLTELRTRAEACDFKEKDRMIRDKIVFTHTGKLQELLLRETDLTLGKAIDICRAFEHSAKQVKEMSASSQKINKVTSSRTMNGNPANHGYGGARPKQNDPSSTRNTSTAGYSSKNKKTGVVPNKECNFCGKTHQFLKSKCPAWGKTCAKCQGRNHFANKCKQRVNTVEEDYSDTDNLQGLQVLKVKGRNRTTALMKVNGCDVRFQLDSGADVNTICQRFVKKTQVLATPQKLVMWNKTKLKPLGETILDVKNPKTGEITSTRFTVVPNGFNCLLGSTTVQEMGLITVNNHKFVGKVQTESEDLGDLGEAKLCVDPNVKPKILPSRRIPIALESDVQVEINRLVGAGVLVAVDEPTEWVSQMAVVRKPSGKLRICIDPQPLNVALQREHYRLPTLDDVLPKFNDAKIFTKLDVKAAYWHVKLDYESSILTTMITPFGRFRWARLPFGLKVSSEIFQKRLHQAIGDLPGVISVADDIVVIGYGKSRTQAEENHKVNLEKLQTRCKERNIKLNEEKAAIKQTSITFMGHIITDKGVEADPGKVEAIQKMPAPTNVQGVKRLCGMIQYLAKFMPNLASSLEPIRMLTRKDTPWNWSDECQEAFQRIKDSVSATPVLAYYDPHKELIVQVDSSSTGLGTVLLQDGKPIEYASRALTSSEVNWAQIEKEMLAVVFGLERFDQYTCGREVIVQNDHKPLKAILNKPLSQGPKRLQAMKMRLHRYNINFEYLEGSRLLIADTLSRAYINYIEESPSIYNVDALEEIPDSRCQEVKEATKNDKMMQKLTYFILNGWPDMKTEVPPEIVVYFDMRDTLSIQDGIILKGERIVIPKSLRKDMKNRLHSAHMGLDSMMRRARQAIFWPGMAKEIKQISSSCEICQEHKPRNQKETLNQHFRGTYPWEKIGVDLCELNGRDYLVTVDYFSGFIEVDMLSATTSNQVILTLKKHCARYGIPKCIVSDNGRQLVSREFENFVTNWGINHVTSSPGHQQANGKAESAVKIVKNFIKKCLKEDGDQYLALLEFRNTPKQDINKSPAEIMFGRSTRSVIPTMKKRPSCDITLTEKYTKHQKRVKKYYDKHARDMSQLEKGQPVYFQHPEKPEWNKGLVCDKFGDRSYQVQNKDGVTYSRNRVHIRPESGVTQSDKDQERQNESYVTTSPLSDKTQSNVLSDSGNIQNNNPSYANKNVNLSTKPVRNRKTPEYLKDYVLSIWPSGSVKV